MSDTVIASTEGSVRIIALNRPQVLNALNVDLLATLCDELRNAAGQRALVLQGSGRAFCTGEDLKETLAPRTGAPEELRVALELLQETTRLVTAFRGPVIAAVQGYAIGGGAELALAADFVICSPDTRFRFPEVSIGHALTGGITARLSALVGLARAKHMLLTSRWVEAAEALQIGMIAEVADDPRARALELAKELSAFPPRSMQATKLAVESAAQPSQEVALRWEIDAALYCFSAPEAADAFTNFQDRPKHT
jgi:2-(1,2-epoxy-1,2-dihydrophenyl)acetyl-CoA isomerase